MPPRQQAAPTHERPEPLTPALAFRAAVGGALMGLANLVPGISGGTMLVAVGIYRRFIDAVSDVTRLRLRMPTLGLLAVVVLAALVAIGGLSGVIAQALVDFRWGMFSLFIGLTLGGAPLLLRMTRPFNGAAYAGLASGAAAMLALALLQTTAADGGSASTNWLMLGVAGMAGAAAMILPGVSGAYLLLLLGQYEPIINAIKDAVSAATQVDVGGVLAQFDVIVPVGIGVVVGVVVVANLLRFLLHRYEKATLGVLLGLLLAAPAGLYPFREGVPPKLGDVFDGELVTEQTVAELASPENAKDWPQRTFPPTLGHIGGSLALILAGFVITLGIARLGNGETGGEGVDRDQNPGERGSDASTASGEARCSSK
jgi:putative membrane protein